MALIDEEMKAFKEYLERKHKPELLKIADTFDYHDLTFGTKTLKKNAKAMPATELKKNILKRRQIENEISEIESRKKLKKKAMEVGVSPDDVLSKSSEELRYMILNGGYTEEEIAQHSKLLGKKYEAQKERERKKWEEVDYLRKNIDKVRGRYRKDLKKKGQTKEKVAAVVIGLQDQTRMRIGESTTEDVYGASSMPLESIEVDGDTVNFYYQGKQKKPQSKSTDDKLLIEALEEVMSWSEKHPCGEDKKGKKLAFCVTGRGRKVRPISGADVRDYLGRIADGMRHTHRFRALHATDEVEKAIEEGGSYDEVIRDVSLDLGHTWAVEGKKKPKMSTAEKSYIDPGTRAAYSKGRKANNPHYYEVKKKIKGAETRKDIIDYLRKHPKAKAWEAFSG